MIVPDFCPSCGGPSSTAGYAHRPDCAFVLSVPNPTGPGLMGWTCPTCGGGVSPLVDRCPCKPAPLPLTRLSDGTSFTVTTELNPTQMWFPRWPGDYGPGRGGSMVGS